MDRSYFFTYAFFCFHFQHINVYTKQRSNRHFNRTFEHFSTKNFKKKLKRNYFNCIRFLFTMYLYYPLLLDVPFFVQFFVCFLGARHTHCPPSLLLHSKRRKTFLEIEKTTPNIDLFRFVILHPSTMARRIIEHRKKNPCASFLFTTILCLAKE